MALVACAKGALGAPRRAALGRGLQQAVFCPRRCAIPRPFRNPTPHANGPQDAHHDPASPHAPKQPPPTGGAGGGSPTPSPGPATDWTPLLTLFLSGIVAVGGATWLLSHSIGSLEARQTATEARLMGVEARLDRLDQKLDQKFNQLDQKLDQKFNQLDQKLDQKFDQLLQLLVQRKQQ